MRNNFLAQQSNDISSTKDYTNAMNTFFNQNTPLSIIPTHLGIIKKDKGNLKNKCITFEFPKNCRNNLPESISVPYVKSPNDKIVFNSAKSFSAKPKKYFSDVQKSTKMKIIELNSNLKQRNNTTKQNKKYIYNSINQSLGEEKITPRVSSTQNNNNSISKKN